MDYGAFNSFTLVRVDCLALDVLLVSVNWLDLRLDTVDSEGRWVRHRL